MHPWSIFQLVTMAVAVIFLFGGQKLPMPVLGYVRLAIMGVAAIVVGLEAVDRRRIVLGSRYHYDEETYLGLAATAQGLLLEHHHGDHRLRRAKTRCEISLPSGFAHITAPARFDLDRHWLSSHRAGPVRDCSAAGF